MVLTEHPTSTADETRWLVFVETAGKTGFRWWLWVFADGQTVIYKMDPSRSRQVPQGHLGEDARGVLLVDRYSAYKAMNAVKSGSLLLAFCWVHVRRKNYCGSGAKWNGRLAETMFSILATLTCWNFNGRTWLTWHLDACAAAGGHAPRDIESFHPWNLAPEHRAALAGLPAASSPSPDDTS